MRCRSGGGRRGHCRCRGGGGARGGARREAVIKLVLGVAWCFGTAAAHTGQLAAFAQRHAKPEGNPRTNSGPAARRLAFCEARNPANRGAERCLGPAFANYLKVLDRVWAAGASGRGCCCHCCCARRAPVEEVVSGVGVGSLLCTPAALVGQLAAFGSR